MVAVFTHNVMGLELVVNTLQSMAAKGMAHGFVLSTNEVCATPASLLHVPAAAQPDCGQCVRPWPRQEVCHALQETYNNVSCLWDSTPFPPKLAENKYIGTQTQRW